MTYISISDIYWVGVKDGNLPPHGVNVVIVGDNIIGRARYGSDVIGGRIAQHRKDFVACLDEERIRGIYIYEVTISCIY